MIFVNLPVQDLGASVAFFTSLGFAFDEQFTDENATCMVVSEQACVMLLVRPFFASLTFKDVADSSTTEVLLAVSAQSRDEVDIVVDRALALGGAMAGEPSDEAYIYGRSFYDLDGHGWEVMWMDAAAVA
ncbi:MAG: VOC family protein [Nocardioidaceae bacterium]